MERRWSDVEGTEEREDEGFLFKTDGRRSVLKQRRGVPSTNALADRDVPWYLFGSFGHQVEERAAVFLPRLSPGQAVTTENEHRAFHRARRSQELPRDKNAHHHNARHLTTARLLSALRSSLAPIRSCDVSEGRCSSRRICA